MSQCKQLRILNNSVFSSCSKLSSFLMPPEITEIASGAFQSVTNLKRITLPDTVETIRGFKPPYGRAFAYSGIEQIDISTTSKLKIIESDVFLSSKLSYFYFPEFCTSVSAYAFAGCPIIEFSIHPNNKMFKIDKKILYTGENNETLFCVSALTTGTFVIPSFVTIIGEAAMRCVKVSKIIMNDKVKTLNSWCFGETLITEINISNNPITYIGDSNFNGCSQLETVVLPKSLQGLGNQVFSSCSKLKNIVLPEGLKSMRGTVFQSCDSLTKITLPSSLVSIGDGVFAYIPNIEVTSLSSEIVVSNSVLYKDKGASIMAFLGSGNGEDFTIQSSCTSIANKAFASKNIGKVLFSGNTNLVIGEQAFESSTIKSIELPPGLTSISQKAFQFCYSLTKVAFLGNSLTSIPDYCFNQNTQLRTITLPSSIEMIGISSFRYCTSIEDIGLSNLNSLQSIGSQSFSFSGLKTANLGRSVISVGLSSFYKSKISSLSISCDIEQELCSGCDLLSTLNIEEGVTVIKQYSFYECRSLSIFTIPKTLQTISAFAFQSCDSLTEITLSLNCNLNTVVGGLLD